MVRNTRKMFGGRKIRGGGIEEYMPSTGNYFDGASSWFGDMTNRAKSAAGISVPMAAPIRENRDRLKL